MDILIRFLMVLEAIVCFLLIGIVLMQRSKGQGAGLSFGGGGAEAVFGAQVGNVLTRMTVVLAVIFLGNTTLLTVLRPQGGRGTSLTDRIAPERTTAVPGAEFPAADDPDFERQITEMLDSMAVETAGVPDEDAAPVVTEPVTEPETETTTEP